MKPRCFLLSVLGILLVAAPAQGNQLKIWGFDRQQDLLSFTTDEDVSPIAKLIGNPTRIIIDLPGIRLGQPKINRAIGGSVKSVRVGQFKTQITRFVVELSPGYQVNPKDIQIQATSRRNWTIDLPSPQRGTYPSGQKEIDIDVPHILPGFMSEGTIGGVLRAGRELKWLEQRLAAVHTRFPVVNPGLFCLDLETGNYMDLRGGKAFPAASVIKLPILVAFFQDLDAKKVSLDETLVMRPELIASGSGYMQDSRPWSKFSARYTLTKMIETSDNTATNMIIKRLGGAAVLNQRFRSWGLKQTVIRNWLPDLSGTNTVSAQDLTVVLTKLAKGNLLSPMSRKRALYILKLTKTKSLLPPGLGRGSTIAHKTGDIGFAIGDAGIIYMPSGRQYIAAVLLKRPYNHPQGRDYIQAVSKIVYTYFSKLAKS